MNRRQSLSIIGALGAQCLLGPTVAAADEHVADKPTSSAQITLSHGDIVKIKTRLGYVGLDKGVFVGDLKEPEATRFAIEKTFDPKGPAVIYQDDKIHLRITHPDHYLQTEGNDSIAIVPGKDHATEYDLYPVDPKVAAGGRKVPLEPDIDLWVKCNHPDRWLALRSDADHGGRYLYAKAHRADAEKISFAKQENPSTIPGK